MKKNILILTTISHGGGTEKLILDQLKYYNKNKFRLFVVVLKEGNIEAKMTMECKKAGAEYFNIHTTNPFLASLRINSIIEANKIDLIHCNLLVPELIALLLRIMRPKVKIIISKHNTDPFRKEIAWRAIGFFTSRSANRIICVSDAVSEFIRKYESVDQTKITVVKNGIDTSAFKKIAVDRRKLGLKKADFVVGIVGRIEEQKGHKYLIEAIHELDTKLPALKLIIIGTGYMEEGIKKLVRKYGLNDKVKFLGFREDVNYCYNCMDVFCLPSLYEGFGLVVVEAMAAETPVIVSRIDGITEIVTPNEGFLTEPKNIQDIEEAISYIYKNKDNQKMKQMIKNAKKKSSQFDIKNNIRQVEQAYLEVFR